MDFPFTKCLRPKKIINPHTGEHLVVPCGSCPACSMRKSNVNAFRCELEALSHKYCMFVTLTYNNVSIPRMLVKATNRYLDECGEVCDSHEPYAMVDITNRLGTQGTLLGRLINPLILKRLAPKVNMPDGVLPHLSKYDLQLFIKRFRRNLDTYFQRNHGIKAPKIRYYACGEYGPVHFRPHYHVLFWFSEDEIYKAFRQILYKSWSFGRIDCQKSQGKCSKYVAKYLNCFVSLPLIFKEHGTRPFSVHSSHLGEEILKVSRTAIYEDEFDTAVKRIIPDVTSDSEFVLWRSLKTYYFPKCKGFFEKSEYECLYSYKVFQYVRDWTQEDCCAKQARIVLNYIIGVDYKHTDYIGAPISLLDYFKHSCSIDTMNLDDCELYLQRIYSELRLSRHFIEFVCLNNENLYIPMIRKIMDFWSWNDMQNLKMQCQQMEEFPLSDWYSSDVDYQFFFHNQGFKKEVYNDMKAFKMYQQAIKCNARNAVKHKRLNDANRIFDNK